MSKLFENLNGLSAAKRELLELLLEREGLSETSRRGGKPRNGDEAKLAAIWADVLGVADVGIHDNFFELGGDSILSMLIAARAGTAGFALTTRQLFEHPTIAQLATALRHRPAVGATQTLVVGSMPLTPIHRWFFMLDLPNRHHWNLAAMLELRGEVDRGALADAIRALALHHDALRLRAFREDDRWCLVNAGADQPIDLACVCLDGPLEQRLAKVRRACMTHQASLDLAEGPLLRFVLLEHGSDEHRLLMIVHHLAADWMSMRIIFEDLNTAYAQARSGEPIRLPPKTTSFKDWAEGLEAVCTSAHDSEALSFWTVPLLPHVYAGSSVAAEARSEGMTEWAVAGLSPSQTRQLQDASSRLRADMHEILLAALAGTLSVWFSEPQVVIEVESHGRDWPVPSADISRTVGWFTAFMPVAIDLSAAHDLGHTLTRTKEAWRAVSARSFEYMTLRHSTQGISEGISEQLRQSCIGFNYLGHFDEVFPASSPFRLVEEDVSAVYDGEGQKPHVLDCIAYILDGALHVAWGYAAGPLARKEVEHNLARFVTTLEALIGGMADEAPVLLSDFPEADLGADDLAALLARDHTLGRD
jgi:non-ribosomal peptide synthase protein (TIGR01720 family)